MHVGNYVVCVDDSNWDALAFEKMSSLPRKNETYKIRRIIDDFIIRNGAPGIALVGIYGDWNNFTTFDKNTVFEEYHFRLCRFKLIDELEISIECETEEFALTD